MNRDFIEYLLGLIIFIIVIPFLMYSAQDGLIYHR